MNKLPQWVSLQTQAGLCYGDRREDNLMPTVDTTKPTTRFAREERIRLRAEKIYRRRGNCPGSALDDWLLAEKEICEEEEHAMDEALEGSFPASDPPAH